MSGGTMEGQAAVVISLRLSMPEIISLRWNAFSQDTKKADSHQILFPRHHYRT